MIEKITNQLNQLSNTELEEISNFLESQYSVAYSEENKTYRDSVYETLEEIIIKNCPWNIDNICESDSFYTLRIESSDVKNIVDDVEIEWDIEKIEFSDVMEWQRVSDIVTYIVELKREKL